MTTNSEQSLYAQTLPLILAAYLGPHLIIYFIDTKKVYFLLSWQGTHIV